MPVDTVRKRFSPTPAGYSVFADEAESWTEWLRLLPLAAPGTPVRNFRGEVVVPGDDEHLAAVVALDVSGEAQGSVDVLLRLHAEWRRHLDDDRIQYLADSGLELPLGRWAAGDRLATPGGALGWVPQAAPASATDDPGFRDYLNAVFAVSDGPALLAESEALPTTRLAPGAFFLHPDPPAEALIVLDVATDARGDRIMLLARARNPAESLHVLRSDRGQAWFAVRTDQPVTVPRSPPFAWSELRQLRRLWSPPKVACEGSLCPPSPVSSREAASP
jgi:hypothetical protein